jgi:zinc protease
VIVKDRSRDILPLDVTEKTLPNGLKVIVVPTGFPNLISLQIPVQTGSRNEVEEGKSGFAHFFEHMMFRGTKTYPTEAYQAEITKAGARQNAYTSDDLTNFHVTFAKEDLETIVKLEADRFQHLEYSEQAFRTEARAVLGEYNKNSANPVQKLLEVQRNAAYMVHPYKHTTMGFVADIEAMPDQYDYSRTFFDRWYRPERTTILIAGDVKASEAIPLVAKYWGKWRRGSYVAEIPPEPLPVAPVATHVPWPTETLPWLTIAFHGPAFSDRTKDYAALKLLLDLNFGPTSSLYKKLVEQEQKVDQLFGYAPPRIDPSLAMAGARLKSGESAGHVRDEILKTIARARTNAVSPQRLEDAKSNARYELLRSLDNTEAIAETLVEFVHFDRSFDTINRFYRLVESLQPEDLLAAAQKYLTDDRMVTTTLSHAELSSMSEPGTIAAFAPSTNPAAAGADLRFIVQKSALPQLNVKIAFECGSVRDPEGKEGLAALAASMIAEAGSRPLRYDEITKALFPIAGAFRAQVDKELTVFTGVIHRDNWQRFLEIVLPQLLDPGYREDDFRRLKDAQLNALREDLRSSDEEELGRERLQANVFRDTRYGHPIVGTVAGIESITLDDVRAFLFANYTVGNLRVGVAGDVPDEMIATLRRKLSRLPSAPVQAPPPIVPRSPQGFEVEIIEKETRAVATSIGVPIEVTRSHDDFAALSIARAWLGEHRSSVSHLYQRIREIRGMNYGAYCYIEAFPRGGQQFFPDANLPRRSQIFEIWIRPVMPQNAVMSLRIALHELRKLITNGLSADDFESTRNYLMKNVYVMTATQDQQLGYAIDSEWYGIGEYTSYMRERLAKVTKSDVEAAVRRHLRGDAAFIVMIAKNAEELRSRLIANVESPVAYDSEKSQELLDEDREIAAHPLEIDPAQITITPVESVFV